LIPLEVTGITWSSPEEVLTTVKVPVESTERPPVLPGMRAVDPSVPLASLTYW